MSSRYTAQRSCNPLVINALAELTRDACLVMGPDAVILVANEEAANLYGYPVDEFVGMHVSRLCTAEAAQSLSKELAQAPGGGLLFNSMHVHKDGTQFPVEVGWKQASAGCCELLVAHVRDVSERLGLEARVLLKSEVFDSTLDSIIVHDLEGNLVLANRTAAARAGMGHDEFMRLGRWGWVDPGARRFTHERIALLKEKGSHVFESQDSRADGTSYPVEVHARVVHLGGHTMVISVIRDISERVAALETMKRMAYSDPLTGLANRASFMTSIERAIDDARRHDDVLGVVFLDLDDFKPINDRLGHAAGDQVLVAMAERFSGALRSTDTVARMGGDEFAVVLPRLANGTTALVEAIRKLATCVAVPTTVNGEEVSVTASIGAAIFESERDDADTLLAKADGAMYAAKRTGVVWQVWGEESQARVSSSPWMPTSPLPSP